MYEYVVSFLGLKHKQLLSGFIIPKQSIILSRTQYLDPMNYKCLWFPSGLFLEHTHAHTHTHMHTCVGLQSTPSSGKGTTTTWFVLGLFCSCFFTGVHIGLESALHHVWTHPWVCKCLFSYMRVPSMYTNKGGHSFKKCLWDRWFLLKYSLIFKAAHFYCRIYAGFMSLINKAIKIVYRIMRVTQQLT